MGGGSLKFTFALGYSDFKTIINPTPKIEALGKLYKTQSQTALYINDFLGGVPAFCTVNVTGGDRAFSVETITMNYYANALLDMRGGFNLKTGVALGTASTVPKVSGYRAIFEGFLSTVYIGYSFNFTVWTE